MTGKIVKHEGKDYLQIQDKLIPIQGYDDSGKPIISCWSEEKTNESGGKDCTVHVPCFQLGSKQQKVS